MLYYDAIPDAIPMNWQTGVIASTATSNDRFWKRVHRLRAWRRRHLRSKTLYGTQSGNNTYSGNTYGTVKITAKSSLTGTPAPYMHYQDCPVHPRLHMWFGPMTMLGFLSVEIGCAGLQLDGGHDVRSAMLAA